MVSLSLHSRKDANQLSLGTGNIIANEGFTHHLGFLNSEGKMTLNANHTALWGAMQSLGQLVGMLGLNPISDRIGRKMTLYALWIILAGVSIAHHCSNTAGLI
jgi:MFS family permease